MQSRYKSVGWRNESLKHSLARRGIKTKITPLDFASFVSLDVDRYKGKWYQIASTPAWFSKGCTDTKAEYIKKTDGTIEVKNTCDVDGKKKIAKGVASVVADDSLAVSFAPLGLDNLFNSPNYKVLYTDYKVSVVGTPDKKYLWVLSRVKNISADRYKKLITIAKNKGYDVSKLKR